VEADTEAGKRSGCGVKGVAPRYRENIKKRGSETSSIKPKGNIRFYGESREVKTSPWLEEGERGGYDLVLVLKTGKRS